MHYRHRNAILTLALITIFSCKFWTGNVSQINWNTVLDSVLVDTWTAAAIKPVKEAFIPSHKERISKKQVKKSIWKRLKFWKKNKVKRIKEVTSQKTELKKTRLDISWGTWVLAFIMTLFIGILLFYLLLYLTVALIINELNFLAILVFILGLFGIALTVKALWNLFTRKTGNPQIANNETVEDVMGNNELHPEPAPEDIPRYQFLDLNNSEITLCIYNTQSGETPVLVRMGDKTLSNHYGMENEPQCFDLNLSREAKNELHFETDQDSLESKELLRIVVEDGDIAREIFVRKGGVLELFVK